MTQRPRQTWLWASIAVLVLLMATACGPVERLKTLRRSGAPPQVPTEMSGLWEVWQVLHRDFGGRETLDNRKLSEGAIQGMLVVVGDKAPQYLTADDYNLDTPQLGAVWQAWQLLSQRLGKDNASVSPQDLQRGAIRGMLQALDNPYTVHLLPEQYELESLSLHSKFDGIGVYVSIVEERLTVLLPIADTPAERAGIVSGDVILEVDGVSTQGMSVAEAARKIRGPRGTSVELLVLHPREESPKRIQVTRDVVKQETVFWEYIGEGLAYLRISEFLDDTDEDVEAALDQIIDQELKGLILDVRRNPGGLLDTTIAVASQFLGEGLVMYQIDGHDKRTDMKVRGGGIARDIPTVVLTDRGSASSSEILAGALQDHQRALLIGTRTFGKGTVNQLQKLSDGSGLYVASALWYTPTGRMIEGEGLSPNIEVLMDLRVPVGSRLDDQLSAGVQYLLAEIRAPAR